MPTAFDTRNPITPEAVKMMAVRADPYSSSTAGPSWRIHRRLKRMCRRPACR
jgi:hypothetical protein